ncbi:hypothetical protein N658DRAFT_494745 [Parathielavia hyrcaniae]|uniref:Uncharacterized protein n=1 Tax=Parathielavia hyrcaniae TaxID=113614 RepID=A0AAN6Q5P6_9PEZI|nr:hypothetical protein N658DRAFT_494745 [Parathielavia hyrcaniae]
MTARGKGRPPSRSAQDPGAGPSRRSTRNQQQYQDQHNAAQPDEVGVKQQQEDFPEDPQQDESPHGLPAAQPEAPMAAPVYHQNIDPAITGAHDGTMPPPPVPIAKSVRGQAASGPHVSIARRGTRRDARARSISSIQSVPGTDAFSSHPEPEFQGNMSQMGTPAPASGARASSMVSSGVPDTSSQKAAKAKLMQVMLPRTSTATGDLFDHLCSNSAHDEMWEAVYGGFKKVFNTYRSYYLVDVVDPVLDPAFVTGTMGIDRASPKWQMVVRIVSAVNIAAFLDDARTFDQLRDPLPVLQEWDSTFSTFFTYGEPDEAFGATMREQVIEHALMIRTLLSIFTLEKFQRESPTGFEPLPQLMRIWLDGDMSVDDVQAAVDHKRELLQLKPLAPSDFGAAAFARERSGTRFGSMWLELQKQAGQPSLNLGELYEQYPQDEFLDNVQDFVKKSFGRIKVLLHQGTSPARDPALPFAPDGNPRADSQIRSQLEADAMAHSYGGAEPGAQPARYNIESLRLMKQLEQAPEMYADAQQHPASSYSPAPRIPYPPGFSSPAPNLAYPDPTQRGGFEPNGSIYAASAADVSGKKRRAPKAAPAAGEGDASATPQTKKQRTKRKKNAVPEASMASPSTAAPAGASFQPPVPPSQYPPLPGTQDEPDFDALAQRTKEISAAARKVKEPQVRTAWVRNDVALLVKAVNTYQCKWSAIEKEIKAGTIPFQRPRDQQALRDKARLLKQDFLKADALLPRGFDLVVLGKKEIAAVKAVGKNPFRKETDVDERGMAINTEYGPDMAAAPAPMPDPLPESEPQPEQQQLLPQPEVEEEPQPEHQAEHQLEEHQPAMPEGLVA